MKYVYLSFISGLLPLWRLIVQGHYQLRINIEDWDGTTKYAHYGYFMIGKPADNYTLHVHGYSGTAGMVVTRIKTGYMLLIHSIYLIISSVSQGLTGELLVYQCLWHPESVVRRLSTFVDILFSRSSTASQSNSNFIYKLPRVGKRKCAQMFLVT